MSDAHHHGKRVVRQPGGADTPNLFLHQYTKSHTPQTAAILSTLQELVMQQRECAIPTTDIVHYDFQPYNILGEQQKISGIIDWEGVCAGDCVFDLVTLLFYNYDDAPIREALWRYLFVRSTIQIISIYLAHLILRQVDWSLRFHDTATSQLYIDRAEAILHYLKSAYHENATQNTTPIIGSGLAPDFYLESRKRCHKSLMH